MAVTTTHVRQEFAGNGVATEFPFTFALARASDVLLYYGLPGIQPYLISAGAFGITLSTSVPGGFLAFAPGGTPAPTGARIILVRQTAATQGVVINNQDGFHPKVVTDALDRGAMVDQDVLDATLRGIRAPLDELALPALPQAAVRANRVLAFDSLGFPLTLPATAAGAPLGEASLATATVSSGTTSRTLAERFADPFNVRDFGALGNGTADDTPAFLAAVAAALAAGGRTVFVPAGTWRITAPIQITGGVCLRGAGLRSTIILLASATADGLVVGDGVVDVSGSGIEELSVRHAVTRTAGASIRYRKAGQCWLRDFYIYQPFQGLVVENTTLCYFERGYIEAPTAATGIGVKVEGGNDQYFRDILVTGQSGAQPLYGWAIVATEAAWLDNCGGLMAGTPCAVVPGVGQTVKFCFFSNCAFDSSTGHGILIQGAVGATILSLHFVECWAATNALNGVAFNNNGGQINGVRFVSCRFYNNGQNGAGIVSGSNIAFDACVFAGNSQSSSGTYHGASVNAGVLEFGFVSCRAGACDGFASTQGWGIIVQTGASNHYRLIGNDCRNNMTGGLSDNGAGATKAVGLNIP